MNELTRKIENAVTNASVWECFPLGHTEYQIKNFMCHLRAGLDADHASLGALVSTQTEKDGVGRLAITSILEESDVARRGVDTDYELSGRVVALGSSPKTENMWYDMSVRDGDRIVATMRNLTRFMKASSPLYGPDV